MKSSYYSSLIYGWKYYLCGVSLYPSNTFCFLCSNWNGNGGAWNTVSKYQTYLEQPSACSQAIWEGSLFIIELSILLLNILIRFKTLLILYYYFLVYVLKLFLLLLFLLSFIYDWVIFIVDESILSLFTSFNMVVVGLSAVVLLEAYTWMMTSMALTLFTLKVILLIIIVLPFMNFYKSCLCL